MCVCVCSELAVWQGGGEVTAVRGIGMFDVNEAANKVSPHCGKCQVDRVVFVCLHVLFC